VLAVSDFYFELGKVERKAVEGKHETMSFHCQAKELAGSLLVFHDCHPENNPVTLPLDHLEDYGFRRLLHAKNFSYDMQIDEALGRKELDVTVAVDEVGYSSSAGTTIHLQNHIADLLKCLPKKRSGITTAPNKNKRPTADVREIGSDCELPSDE